MSQIGACKNYLGKEFSVNIRVQTEEMISEDAERVLTYLAEVEEIAEEILSEKQQIINLDRQRQKTREAIRTVNKEKNEKDWICFGNMFIKLSRKQTQKILNEDFERLDAEISNIRQGLKPKVSKLRDAEHGDNLKAFHLNPLSKDEMAALESIL